MESYIVEGGFPLQGQIDISGNKNGALAAITTALLTDEKVILHNIPSITDIKVLVDILLHIGVRVSFNDEHTCEIEARDCHWESVDLPVNLVESIRASLLLIGPLLTRSQRIL